MGGIVDKPLLRWASVLRKQFRLCRSCNSLLEEVAVEGCKAWYVGKYLVLVSANIAYHLGVLITSGHASSHFLQNFLDNLTLGIETLDARVTYRVTLVNERLSISIAIRLSQTFKFFFAD